jgi:hypothetical protein
MDIQARLAFQIPESVYLAEQEFTKTRPVAAGSLRTTRGIALARLRQWPSHSTTAPVPLLSSIWEGFDPSCLGNLPPRVHTLSLTLFSRAPWHLEIIWKQTAKHIKQMISHCFQLPIVTTLSPVIQYEVVSNISHTAR